MKAEIYCSPGGGCYYSYCALIARSAQSAAAVPGGAYSCSDYGGAGHDRSAPVSSCSVRLLAASHNAALRLLQAASTRQNPETAMKLTVTACRVMNIFRDGLMVMHRLRHGDQRVVVQHLRLSDNAQAIVAGELNKHAGE